MDVVGTEFGDRDRVQDGEQHVEARSTLDFLLARLDEPKRRVFVLYEIEGMTMKEVSEVLECPLQTAYSRLHAARAILTEALANDEKGGAS